MKMTPLAVVIGSLIILATIVFVVVLLPYVHTNRTTPSEIFRSRTTEEASGRKLYIANGCVYCHSQSIRTIDWGLGAERIAQAGIFAIALFYFLGNLAFHIIDKSIGIALGNIGGSLKFLLQGIESVQDLSHLSAVILPG